MTAMTSTRATFDRTHMSATLKNFYDYMDAEPVLKQDSNSGTSSHSSTLVLPIDAYQIKVTTSGNGGAGGNDTVAMPDPATNGIIGERHLVKLAALGHAGDHLLIDKTLLANGGTIAAVTMTAVGDWVLLEHQGPVWWIVAAKSGVVS